jgi:hypothetical protein
MALDTNDYLGFRSQRIMLIECVLEKVCPKCVHVVGKRYTPIMVLLVIVVLVVLALCAGTIFGVGVLIFGRKRAPQQRTTAPVQTAAQRAEIAAAYKRAADRQRAS